MARTATATADDTRHENGKLKKFVWLVVGPNTWGKGFTFGQAFAACEKPKHFVAFVSADPWISVDDMGGICYYPTDPDSPHPQVPYFAVGARNAKGKAYELTVEGGSTQQLVGTGKPQVVDERYGASMNLTLA